MKKHASDSQSHSQNLSESKKLWARVTFLRLKYHHLCRVLSKNTICWWIEVRKGRRRSRNYVKAFSVFPTLGFVSAQCPLHPSCAKTGFRAMEGKKKKLFWQMGCQFSTQCTGTTVESCDFTPHNSSCRHTSLDLKICILLAAWALA